jgi:glycosyltransferase involved in cell wall biosynthesis
MPECFKEAKQRLAEETLHFGYAKSRAQYAELLRRGDVLVSTARHEFYGIAVLEGLRAGCYPLLPESLSYPELYDKEFLYTPGKLVKKLEEYLRYPVCLEQNTQNRLTERFSWHCQHEHYTKWLLN